VTNIEVAVRTLQLFGYDPQSDFSTRLAWIADRPFNDHDYHVDGSKLKQLGWTQNTAFEDGLERTVDWYRKHLDTWWESETVEAIKVQTPAVDTELKKDPMTTEVPTVQIVVGSA
jgi:dTDP-glucose 4,6-dehydratase